MVGNINANGDFTVSGDFHDNSVNLSRYVWDLSDEELVVELLHRKTTLKFLKRTRWKKLSIGVVIGVVLAAPAAVSSVLPDVPAILALISALGSIATIMLAIKSWGGRTSDEARQVDAIERIRQVGVDRNGGR